MPGQHSDQKRVLLLIAREGGYPGQVLEGVRHFADMHDAWLCEGMAPDPEQVKAIQHDRPDGIISGVGDPRLVPLLRDLGVPLVDVYYWFKDAAPVFVQPDNEAVGRLAAEHFVQRGYRDFGFFRGCAMPFAVEREQAFVRSLQALGRACQTYAARSESRPWLTWSMPDPDLLLSLRGLPRPIGVFCANDLDALRLVQTCRQGQVSVPQDIAVLGVDNDALLLEFSRPRLSSVETSSRQIGYTAAALLDQMMDHQQVEPGVHRVAPTIVITRQSTDILAIRDPDVAQAIAWMREHLDRPFSIAQMSHDVAIPRRRLERLFLHYLGRGPYNQTLHMRAERAQQLLLQTDLPLPQVAHKCGFAGVARFTKSFHQFTGTTPADFRQSVRRGGEQ
jgi:LacI family transcriptional regulator